MPARDDRALPRRNNSDPLFATHLTGRRENVVVVVIVARVLDLTQQLGGHPLDGGWLCIGRHEEGGRNEKPLGERDLKRPYESSGSGGT